MCLDAAGGLQWTANDTQRTTPSVTPCHGHQNGRPNEIAWPRNCAVRVHVLHFPVRIWAEFEIQVDRENRHQDMFLLLAEAMAVMASDKSKAEFYRKRLERGMEWDKKAKAWKWKDAHEPGK